MNQATRHQRLLQEPHKQGHRKSDDMVPVHFGARADANVVNDNSIFVAIPHHLHIIDQQ
jgi:hypothetical protein